MLVAPLLPVGGMALVFGPAVNPVHELALAAPMSIAKLLLLRIVAVLAVSVPLSAAASMAIDGPNLSSLAWLGPSIALAAAALALMTLMQPTWAAGTVGVLWTGAAFAARVLAPDSPVLLWGPVQASFLGLIAVAVPVIARRRERLELADRGAHLFRQYVSPQVAESLIRDPSRADLGGAVVEISVIFADLPGFTALSETAPPDEVVAMLNRIFGEAVPLLMRFGGTIDKFVGDALMALFNAPARLPGHSVNAARAALALQAMVHRLAEEDPELPRFRIGVNTGRALVGNIGSAELRNFTAIGDAVNVAQRLQQVAEPGQVVIGPGIHRALAAARCRPLGAVTVKGRREPIDAFVLDGLE
jgi:class 3 adenylate cyclase